MNPPAPNPGDGVQPPTPKKEDLAGGVDLASPSLTLARNFLSQMAAQQPVGIAVVVLTANGHVAMTGMAPGGPIHVIGIMATAQSILMNQLGSSSNK